MVFLLALQLSLSAAGQPGAEEHLLAGASAFREARYDAALVEFRVAKALGVPGAAGYAGATLVKLGRPEDAVEAFGDAPAEGDDAILGYYRAMACYDARLYACADRLLADVGERAGPRIQEQARKARASIAAALSGEPSRGSVDWYIAACFESRGQNRLVLAGAYCDEAVALAGKRGDRYRLAEVAAQRAALPARQAGGAR